MSDSMAYMFTESNEYIRTRSSELHAQLHEQRHMETDDLLIVRAHALYIHTDEHAQMHTYLRVSRDEACCALCGCIVPGL